MFQYHAIILIQDKRSWAGHLPRNCMATALLAVLRDFAARGMQLWPWVGVLRVIALQARLQGGGGDQRLAWPQPGVDRHILAIIPQRYDQQRLQCTQHSSSP